MHFTFFPT